MQQQIGDECWQEQDHHRHLWKVRPVHVGGLQFDDGLGQPLVTHCPVNGHGKKEAQQPKGKELNGQDSLFEELTHGAEFEQGCDRDWCCGARERCYQGSPTIPGLPVALISMAKT